MKTLVNTIKPLISHWVKIVLMMVLVVSFTLPAYTYTQEEFWEWLNTKTNILYKRGQYSEATNVAKEALKVAAETFGSDHINVATSLNNLAGLYNEQG
ncbi:MAG: tetratricopeptide repeat protein, partial [Candidatus Neomarinimicrobiota bacterium]